MDAVIIDAVRTPIGALGGALAAVRPDDLAALTLRTLLERTGLDPADGVGIPGAKLRAALEGVIPILVDEKIAKAGSAPAKALAELIDAAPATTALGAK